MPGKSGPIFRFLSHVSQELQFFENFGLFRNIRELQSGFNLFYEKLSSKKQMNWKSIVRNKLSEKSRRWLFFFIADPELISLEPLFKNYLWNVRKTFLWLHIRIIL